MLINKTLVGQSVHILDLMIDQVSKNSPLCKSSTVPADRVDFRLIRDIKYWENGTDVTDSLPQATWTQWYQRFSNVFLCSTQVLTVGSHVGFYYTFQSWFSTYENIFIYCSWWPLLKTYVARVLPRTWLPFIWCLCYCLQLVTHVSLQWVCFSKTCLI